MKCPRCESRELWVLVHFSGFVLCESDPFDKVVLQQSASLHSDFDRESPCRCASCSWAGTVLETQELETSFPSEGGLRTRTRHSTVSSVAEVQRRLHAQPCPVIWSDCIRYLMKRTEAYEVLAEKYEELQRRIDGDSDCLDTKIL